MSHLKIFIPGDDEQSSIAKPDTTIILPDHLETLRSHIHGYGLFSKKVIEPLELIWQEKLKHGTGLPYDNDGPLRWVNHCDDPSAFLLFEMPKHRRYSVLKLIAKTRIAIGQEITYDYGVFGHKGDEKECTCGAPGCTGRFCLRVEWGERV